jgi:hypothetical protein
MGLAATQSTGDGNVKTVPLHGARAAGLVALVDDNDYELVSQHRWHVNLGKHPGCRDTGPYAQTNIRRNGRNTTIRMHRLLTDWSQTDHINGNGLDNRRSNLRPATPSQNRYNQRPWIRSSSRFKGVTWHKKLAKWQAGIKVAGTFRYLGVFASEEAASAAYEAAALEVQGAYAYSARPDAS